MDPSDPFYTLAAAGKLKEAVRYDLTRPDYSLEFFETETTDIKFGMDPSS